MADTVRIVSGTAAAGEIDVDDLTRIARDAPAAVLVSVASGSVAAVAARMAGLPGLIEARIADRQERRIEDMVDVFLDVDPLDRVEAEIDADNAERRSLFLTTYEVLDSRAVHRRAGHTSGNASQTATSWKRQRRIFGLPFKGGVVYPAFQFDADGQPLATMRDVLRALPAQMTPWQTAFWLVSPCDMLDGAVPLDLIGAADDRVVAAAQGAGALPLG